MEHNNSHLTQTGEGNDCRATGSLWSWQTCTS